MSTDTKGAAASLMLHSDHFIETMSFWDCSLKSDPSGSFQMDTQSFS